jgi:hypothetical protein
MTIFIDESGIKPATASGPDLVATRPRLLL